MFPNLLVALSFILVAEPMPAARRESPPAPSFRNQVIPLLTKIGCNSGACHGALAGKGGFKLSLRGYDPDTDHFVMTRQALGRRVNRVEPERSLILLKPTMTVPHGGGQRIEIGSPAFQLLADWIAAGAPGPRADDVRIRRLEIMPAQAALHPRDTLQVTVHGWYSDGRSEDVTKWAKFNSTEDLVATVDQDGKVRVTGHGEAAVTVWFSNLVASSRIVSPADGSVVDSWLLKAAPRKNFIDDLVLKKLEVLRIPPSPPCSDAEFIRRAYLDAAGILPLPEDVKRFLVDPSPHKRARLIDMLLARPEYVDYWAYQWSDLFLVSSRKLPQPAVWAFYQFIRQSVADNKPWDRLAREILTVRGSNLQNGAANYFLLHKDVTELTEATSVTFLGTSITCARCHNHPLEKWTQDQYWQMANVFARVGLKNGDRGEVIVQSDPTGEVLHPRTGVAMPPAALDAAPLPASSTLDRRAYFADWLTKPDNPYFARALVNRVWKHFLGRGLVEAEDDLRDTNPPTNPELLEALARHFRDHGFDLRDLIRTIMESASYQRSAAPLAGNRVDDRFYSRFLVRRLPAEVILDAYSQVAQVPSAFTQVLIGPSGGVADFRGAPLGTRALQLPDSLVASAFLEEFGRPERSQTCSCERQQDSSVGQALHLNNGETLNDKLRAKNSRVSQWLTEKIGDREAIGRLFMLALARQPSPAEEQRFLGLLAEAGKDIKTTRREALEDLFWAVLSSREFLFNH